MNKNKGINRFSATSYNISKYFSGNISANLKDKTYRKDERKLKSISKFMETLYGKLY